GRPHRLAGPVRGGRGARYLESRTGRLGTSQRVVRPTPHSAGSKVTLSGLLDAETLENASTATTENVVVLPRTSPQTGSVSLDGMRTCVVSPVTCTEPHGDPDTR